MKYGDLSTAPRTMRLSVAPVEMTIPEVVCQVIYEPMKRA